MFLWILILFTGCKEGKRATEDEMVGWLHRPDGHEFEPSPGDGEGWGSLACCHPWGHKQPAVTRAIVTDLVALMVLTWVFRHHSGPTFLVFPGAVSLPGSPRCSRLGLHFPSLALKSVSSSHEPWLLFGECYLDTKPWVLAVLPAARWGRMCVCTSPHGCAHLSALLGLATCVCV